MMGWANGTDRFGGLVVGATKKVALTALDTVKQAVAKIGDHVSDNMDANPTIRPVLDLSAIKKDGGLIAGMVTPPPFSVSANYDKASALAVADRVRRTSANDTTMTEAVTSAQGDTVIYNQTINSPKAISQADSYRQTKNLLSVAKKKGELVSA
jgi:hypothetical protein